MSEQDPTDEERQPAGEPPSEMPAEPPPTPLSQHIGRVVIGVVIVLFGVFAVINAQPVDFSWVFGETFVEIDETGDRVGGGVPLIVLLVSAFVLGLIVGLLVAWQRGRSKRKAAKRKE